VRMGNRNIVPLRAAITWPRGLAVLAFGLAAALASPAAAASVKTIAVTPFSFTDSSSAMESAMPGALPDLSGGADDVHKKRLQHFAEVLKAELEKSGHFHVISLACPSDPCASTPAEGEDLVKAAQKSGATLLVLGGIQKMTSLVIFLRATVYTVASGQPLFSKNYTLRGDNDDAWVRGARELAAEINGRS